MRNSSWNLLGLVVVILAVSLGSPFAKEPVRVGIVVDGPCSINDEVLPLFQGEIVSLLESEFDVRFQPEHLLVADWTVDGIRSAVDRLLADSRVDIIVTLGVIATHDVCRRGALPKPVVAPVVVDVDLQDLPKANGRSGVKNLSYIEFPNNILRDIRAFRNVVDFRKLVILVNEPVTEAIPDIRSKFDGLLTELGVESIVYPVDQSVDEVLAKFPSEVEAVYIAPLIHLPDGEFERLVARLIEGRIPSCSMLGHREVERGVFCGVSSDIFPRLARRVALNVQRILLGDAPETIPTAFTRKEQLTINMATARAIGRYPSWAVLTEATLLNDTGSESSRTVSLSTAADEALEMNLDLAVRRHELAASEKSVGLANAKLLPQINLSILGVQIDEDRAESSFGQQAERTISGSASLSQVIFSEPAFANKSVQRRLQNSREFQRDVLTLDIVQAAATSYLRVLRAKTSERIQKDNLDRTRINLDHAEVREALGSARAAEVLRWQSELAISRKRVIEASADRNIAEIALNRLLHRPAEESFETVEVDLNDPVLLLSTDRMGQYMGNPWDFKIFRRFMAAEALESAPEVHALKQSIKAQERVAGSAKRRFWLPSVGLRAEVDNVFSREGAGSDFAAPAPLSGAFSAPEDLSWQVAVNVSYPLFSGGARWHERTQALENLMQLRLELQATSEKIEQRVRSALHAAGASYAGIHQSQVAAEAATRSLELVQDAYARGAATILDVLDAQNNALVAEEVAADATFDFLIDLLEVERSIGQAVFQMTEEEKDAFYTRLDLYFAQNR